MKTVYVDVLLVLNFIINYFLLLAANQVCGRNNRRTRLLLASFAGAFFALSIFLPPMSQGLQLLYKGIASAAMVRLANPWNGWPEFFKEWAAMLLVTFLFGGALLALRLTAAPASMLYHNGIAYFSISPLVLLTNITLSYIILTLAQRLGGSFHITSGVYDVQLQLFDQSINLRAFLDTGNTLTEPFSGLPVVVGGVEQLRPILPQDVVEAALAPGDKPVPGLRYVPFSSVGGSGLLLAVKGQLLRVYLAEGPAEIENFYVAINPNNIGDQQYQLLLSSSLMQTKKETVRV